MFSSNRHPTFRAVLYLYSCACTIYQHTHISYRQVFYFWLRGPLSDAATQRYRRQLTSVTGIHVAIDKRWWTTAWHQIGSLGKQNLLYYDFKPPIILLQEPQSCFHYLFAFPYSVVKVSSYTFVVASGNIIGNRYVHICWPICERQMKTMIIVCRCRSSPISVFIFSGIMQTFVELTAKCFGLDAVCSQN